MSWGLKDRIDGPLTVAVTLIFLSGVATFAVVRPESTHRESKEGVSQPTPQTLPLPYDLNTPNWTLKLPKVLTEVSGIAVQDRSSAWAVNDEKGTLFQIDLHSGEVTETQKFGKRGDYEGIEAVGSSIVVARSDGRLSRVGPKTTKNYRSPLSKKCDVEGLAFDRRGERLLVACKGAVGPRADRDKRLLYAVRLPDYAWQPEPAYIVSQARLRTFIETHSVEGVSPRQAKHFSPSAVAVQPTTGHIYLLSSRGRALVVLDGRTGQIRSVAAQRPQ